MWRNPLSDFPGIIAETFQSKSITSQNVEKDHQGYFSKVADVKMNKSDTQVPTGDTLSRYMATHMKTTWSLFAALMWYKRIVTCTFHSPTTATD